MESAPLSKNRIFERETIGDIELFSGSCVGKVS